MSSKKAFLINLPTLTHNIINNFSKEKLQIIYHDPLSNEKFLFKQQQKKLHQKNFEVFYKKKKKQLKTTVLPFDELLPCSLFYQDQINCGEITGFNVKLVYSYNPYSKTTKNNTHIEQWINKKCKSIYRQRIKNNKINPNDNIQVIFIFCVFKNFILTLDSSSSIIQYNRNKFKTTKNSKILCHSSIDLLKIMKYSPISLQENYNSIKNTV